MVQHARGLLGLPLIIIRLILDLLEKEDISKFRLISRACRDIPDDSFFRTIVLHDQTPSAKTVNKAICGRLLSRNDTLSEHVRHLKIGPFSKTVNIPATQVLKDLLNSSNRLLDFSWNNAGVLCPKDLLEALHHKWPGARLHYINSPREIVNNPRSKSRIYSPLDQDIMLASQLHSLDVTILERPNHEFPAKLRYYWSELPVVRDTVLRTPQLNELRLGIKHTEEGVNRRHLTVMHTTAIRQNRVDGPSGGLDGVRTPPLDMRPALQVLKLTDIDIAASKMQCMQWLEAMNWKALRRFEVDMKDPTEVFTLLKGNVPQLKALIVRAEDTSNTVGPFGIGLKGLEELVIEDVGPYGVWFDPDLPVCHGETLRVLRINGTGGGCPGANEREIQHIADNCTALQDLAVDIRMYKPGGGNKSGWDLQWPERSIELLSSLRNLRRLHVYLPVNVWRHLEICMPAKYKAWTERAPLVHKDGARASFRQWLERNPKSPLQFIKVTLGRFEQENNFEFTVDRKSAFLGAE